MAPAGVHVAIVDDHPAFLRVAHDLVEATPGFEPVAEISDWGTALDVLAEVDAELVLVDVYMPGKSGIDLVREIKARDEDVVAVLISSHDFSEIPAAAMSCGAAAVVSKEDLSPATLRRLWEEFGSLTTEPADD